MADTMGVICFEIADNKTFTTVASTFKYLKNLPYNLFGRTTMENILKKRFGG